MEKLQRFGLRKTTVGLVSAMIMGVTIIPMGGVTAFAESDNDDKGSEAVVTSLDRLDEDLIVNRTPWIPNTVTEIESEIKSQRGDKSVEEFDYTIQWGDTVWGITQAFDLDMDLFVKVNSIQNPDLIYAGDLVTLDVTKVAKEVVESVNDTKQQVEEKIAKKSDAVSVNKKQSVQSKQNATVTSKKEVVETPVASETVTPEKEESDTPVVPEIVTPEKEESDTPVVPEIETPEKEESETPVVPETETPEKEESETPVVPETPEDVITYKTTYITESVPFTTKYVDDDYADKGVEQVKYSGVNGESKVTISNKYVNGKLVDSTRKSSEITRESVQKVVSVGTGRFNEKKRYEYTDIDFETERINDTSIPLGETVIQSEGRKGQSTVTFVQKYDYDTLLSETKESDVIDKEAVNEVILVGTGVPVNRETGYYVVDQVRFNNAFIKLINEERSSQNIAPLSYHSGLQAGSDIRALETRENYDHVRPDGSNYRTAHSDISYVTIGENINGGIYAGQLKDQVEEDPQMFEAVMAKDFFDSYMKSPGHYRNMMFVDYNSVAVSMQVDYESGRAFNVMTFIQSK